jgi:hypothetical protein
LKFLKHLTAPQPPEALFGDDKKSSTSTKFLLDKYLKKQNLFIFSTK